VITETSQKVLVQLDDRQIPVVQLSANCGSFGSFSYPNNGGSFNEDVAFLVIPEVGRPLEIAFSRFETEQNYDFVSVYFWENNRFRLRGR